MGAWAFVVVYLAAFVVLQLVIYRYLQGRDGDDARMSVAGPPNADRGVARDPDPEGHEHRTVQEPPDRAADRQEPFRRCPNCGATNDPDGQYTFCRNCASRLPG